MLGVLMKTCGLSRFKDLQYIKDEIFITPGTASTEAVLPLMLINMECMGCWRSVVGMMLPSGYALIADAAAIYLTMAALFIVQVMNVHWSIWDQLLVLGVLLLNSKESADEFEALPPIFDDTPGVFGRLPSSFFEALLK